MTIPINNLAAHMAGMRSEIDAAIQRVLDRGWFVLGPEVEAFESSFAQFVGVSDCVTVANGTDALELALRGCGIKAGDTVATVANAGMYATVAIIAIGATPVFMDVDDSSCLTTLEEVEQALAKGVKAVVVTHLYGRAIPEIREMASKCIEAGVALIEDCSQAHGASVAGQQVGSFGDVGCFSFYPTKNLGAVGDGGAITTGNRTIAQKIRMLRTYGWSAKYRSEMSNGRNSRLDEMQAAVLNASLPHLNAWNQRRRAIAHVYAEAICHQAVNAPPVGGEGYVAHLYVIRSPMRDRLCQYLRMRGIGTEVHYPLPDHLQPSLEANFKGTRLPVTERLAEEVLTLPCYPEMPEDSVKSICEAVNRFC